MTLRLYYLARATANRLVSANRRRGDAGEINDGGVLFLLAVLCLIGGAIYFIGLPLIGSLGK